ncbi:MAG: type II toxin-antitoxin system prevent-host-death family antitoxin [bacterium]
MKSVGIKNLKNRLSEYVKMAAAGEVVLVTDRDRVVAELVPPGADRSSRIHDALLAEAVREGWVTPPLIAGGPLPRCRPVASLRTILKELSKDREDR